jgi:hypothetical protein
VAEEITGVVSADAGLPQFLPAVVATVGVDVLEDFVQRDRVTTGDGVTGERFQHQLVAVDGCLSGEPFKAVDVADAVETGGGVAE